MGSRSEQKKRQRLPHFADRLPLGDQGLAVSPFCLGMVREAETVCAAFEAGINFFFLSADLHWPLYENARRGLRQLLARGHGIRDQIVVAACSYPAQPRLCLGPFEELLEAAPELERIDVLIAGAAYATDFPARRRVYRQFRRTGFLGVRAIGTTFHERAAARLALARNRVDIAFVRYNPGHCGARRDLFPHRPPESPTLLFNFKSTYGYVPPQRMDELGLQHPTYWHPEITDYYRFALSRPELDGVLMAPGTPRELAALAEALTRGPLDEEEESYLMDLALVARGAAKVVEEVPA
jgi:hypothetical protein